MRRFSTYLWLNCRQRISENVTEKKKTVKHGNITNETRETESEREKKKKSVITKCTPFAPCPDKSIFSTGCVVQEQHPERHSPWHKVWT